MARQTTAAWEAIPWSRHQWPSPTPPQQQTDCRFGATSREIAKISTCPCQRFKSSAAARTPAVASTCLIRAIERAGFTPGQDTAISLDIAASDFRSKGQYTLARDARQIDSDGLSEMLLGWLARYPIFSIEDPLGEDNPKGMRKLTVAGKHIEVVADDFNCTTAARIERAAESGACNTAH
jgi:enolase